MKCHHFLLLTVLLYAQTSDSARILSVIPAPSSSHFSSAKAIIRELVAKGHEVISISPHDVEGLGKNYTWVQIEVNSLEDAVPNLIEISKQKKTPFGNQLRTWSVMNKYTEHISKLPKLKKFIEEDNSKFDLVLVEEFMSEFLLVFAHKYKAPLVMISTFGSAHYINRYIGNSYELSYVPHEFIDLYGDLSLFDRANNLLLSLFDLTFKSYYSLNFQKDLARKTFSHLPDAPDVEDIRANVSVMFLNSHFSMSVVRPYLPNIVEIGGVHIDEPKPLHQKLQPIFDKAYGVVLVSFGSILDLSKQNPETVTKFLKALKRLNETVILKWDSDTPVPVKSNNFVRLKWLPQNDILAHPKTKAFITHGGLLSSQEAIYHGVPIICMPFFSDQPLNCKKAVHSGYGLGLDFNNIDEEVLYNTIKELVTNPLYSEKAMELSSRFKDRPNTARETAVYWMEYVIRHKGAEFIRSPKRNLYWFQTMFLDVLVVVILGVFVIYKLVAFVLKCEIKRRKEKKFKIV